MSGTAQYRKPPVNPVSALEQARQELLRGPGQVKTFTTTLWPSRRHCEIGAFLQPQISELQLGEPLSGSQSRQCAPLSVILIFNVKTLHSTLKLTAEREQNNSLNILEVLIVKDNTDPSSQSIQQ